MSASDTFPINIERFKKWLMKQDPKARYRYQDACGCPLQRFITEVVKPRKPADWRSDWPFVIVGAFEVYLGDTPGPGRPLDPAVCAVVRDEPHTYGKLLQRVRNRFRRRAA
jgi:hypothetical protein